MFELENEIYNSNGICAAENIKIVWYAANGCPYTLETDMKSPFNNIHRLSYPIKNSVLSQNKIIVKYLLIFQVSQGRISPKYIYMKGISS